MSEETGQAAIDQAEQSRSPHSPEDPDGPPSAYEKHLYFALFICLIGLTLFAVALSTLGFPWHAHQQTDGTVRQVANLRGWGVLLSVSVATALLFFGLHSAACIRREVRVPGSRTVPRRILAVAAIALALVFLAWGGYRLYTLATPSSEPQAPTQFAVAVPLADPAAESANSTSSVEDAEPSDTALMFWSLPRDDVAKGAGFMNMVLASLLTISFGLAYPRIAASGDQEGMGFVQRLVVPALGLALFGVGVGENAQAEDREQNIRLVKSNLPPVVGKTQFQEAYFVNNSEVTRLTSQELQAAISSLIETLEKRQEEPNSPDYRQEIAQLAIRLRAIETNVREGTAVSRTSMRRLARSVEGSLKEANSVLGETSDAMKDTGTTLAAMSAQSWRSYCLLRKGQLQTQLLERRLALEMFRRQNIQDSRNALERAWVGLSGINRREREDRNKIEGQLNQLAPDDQAKVDGLCNEDAPPEARRIGAA